MIDLLNAINLIENEGSYYKDGLMFDQCYFQTNENIEEYIKYFNIKDGNVLTVTSSADHIFYSILYGAKNIDTFDMNKLAYYVMEYKKSAILSLSLKEYQNFFPVLSIPNNESNYFNYDNYKKISNYLSKDAKVFWDYIYNIYKDEQEKLFKLFIYKHLSRYPNSYSEDEDKYNKLKELIPNVNINFYHCNLTNLDNEILKNNNYYDGIILSNIFDWLFDSMECFDTDEIKDIFNNIKKLLKEGHICMPYYDMFNCKDFIDGCTYIDIDDKSSASLYFKKSK